MYRDSLSYSVLFLHFCVKDILHQKGSPQKTGSVLVADDAVFVIQAVVGAGVVGAGQETSHFVLVQIHHTDVAVVVVIVNVICTGLAVCDLLVAHIFTSM